MSKLKRKFIAALAVLFCTLLLLCTASFIPKDEKVAEATSVSTAIQIDLDTTVNGKKFNRNNLQKLYGNILSGTTSYTHLKTNIGTNKGSILKKYSDMTPTTVSLGGMEWNVVAASKNQAGDVVVTLWLSNGAYEEYYSAASFIDDGVGDYAPSEYAMSLVHSTLVGGTYAIGVSDTAQGTQNLIWTAFLQSYRDFINSPVEVCGTDGYQALERATKDSSTYSAGISTCLYPNEAYIIMDGSGNNWTTGTNHWFETTPASIQNCKNYAQWKEDKLWLPSMSEAGYSNGDRGLWNITSATVRADSSGNTRGSWFRSGYHQWANCVFREISDGTAFSFSGTRSFPCAVRPALHLNLSKADEYSLIVLDKPEDVSSVYDGTVKTLSNVTTIPDWYSKYSTVYSDSTKIDITYPDSENNGKVDMVDVSEDGYDVSLTIKDEAKTEYCWSDYNTNSSNTREIKYIITPMPIEVHIGDPEDGKAPKVEILYDPIVQRDKDNDEEYNTVPVIVLEYTGDKITGTATDFSSLLPGIYTATAKIKDGTGANYKLKQTYSKTFTLDTLTVEVKDENIVWQIKNGTGETKPFTADDDGRKVKYNGKAYTLSIDTTKLPQNVKIDTTKGDNNTGYSNAVKTNYQASAYTTTVYLTGKDSDYKPSKTSFTVTWFITQGLYDLSDVAWDYDSSAPSPFTFDPDGHTTYSVKLNIPDELAKEGLKSSFASGSEHSSWVAGEFIAKVTLSGSGNYVTPEKDKPETYIYNGDGDDFPWELKWEVEKYTQNFQWNTGTHGEQKQNGSGKTFYVPTPIETYNLVTVKYYALKDFDTDKGKLKDGAQPVDIANMVVPEDKEHMADGNYVAVLEFIGDFADNYKFGTGAYMQFNTYDQRSTLVITISDTEYVYDGNPHADFASEVTITGATSTDIEKYITYEYFSVSSDGSETTLGTKAPVNAGSYKIKISVNTEGDSYLVINGESEFAYKIKTLVLDIPTYNGELTYDGTDRDVAKLCKLPDGWEKYIEVSIRLGTESVSAVRGMGRYTVTFKFKAGINVAGSTNNVEWKTDKNAAKTADQSVTIVIKQLELHAQEWYGNKYSSRVEFAEANAEYFLDYKVYDAEGNEVDADTVYHTSGEMFVVKVSVKDEHGDNVIIKFADGVSDEFEFYTDGGQEPVRVALPTIPDLTFNGKDQTFDIDYGEYADYIEIDTAQSNPSVLTQFNADEYTIYFKIKRGVNAVWATTGGRESIAVTFKIKPLVLEEPQIANNQKFTYTGSEQTAILNIDVEFLDIGGDYSATNAGEYSFTLSIKERFAGNVVWASAQGADAVKTVKWTIEKAKLSAKWKEGETPELDLPEEFKDLDIEYVYTDENGNTVSKAELEAGKEYTVTAKLKGGDTDNFEFVDDSGKPLKSPTTTDVKFQYKNGESSFPWWILGVIAGVLALLAVIIVIVLKKRNSEDDEEDFYDDDYDYDDEDIEEDYEEDFGDDF